MARALSSLASSRVWWVSKTETITASETGSAKMKRERRERVRSTCHIRGEAWARQGRGWG
eukprot:4677602-Prymnesium_polylepis.1